MEKRKLPDNFTEYEGEEIMSNFDHAINYETAEAIKGKELFSRYSGWNFNGKVWWDSELQKWCCAVFCYGCHKETVSSDDLGCIMMDICSSYGSD